MKQILSLLTLCVLFSVILYSCQGEDDQISVLQPKEVELIKFAQSEPIEGQYIVVFKEEAFPKFQSEDIKATDYPTQKASFTTEAKEVLTTNRIINKDIKQSFVKTIKGIALELDQNELQRLEMDPRVAFIEQDQTVHVSMGGPPGGGGGGGGGGQSTPWGVTRVGGAIDGSSSGTAWIIDSGIDLDHEDLNVDVARSRSFLSGGQSTNPDDQNGHGTHVAGTVAALNNGVGVIGVAAGAPVVSVRVLDRRGSGSISGVIAGVDYVGANAANGDAANMSLGGGVSSALDNAVIAASSACPFALAAGNESQNASNSSPARANGNNIYTVSSMTSSNDSWSSFSNFGNPPVDYCAPGSSVLSTYKGNGYATLSGTSMAAPHVCGILLIGGITSDGTVNGDPDGNPDPIAHH